MKLLVLCGGGGTKLWPASRQSTPKQFTIQASGKSLFQHNIETLLKRYSPKDIILATTKGKEKFLREQALEIPESNWIIETSYKNQGGATVLALAKLYTIDPDETFSTVQVDDLRFPSEKYLVMLKAIDEIVQKEGKLITGGRPAKFAEMGVDYLKLGKRLEKYSQVHAYEMEEFLWRTDYEKTKERIKKGGVITHTNHWSWTPRKMLEAMEKYIPEWAETMKELISSFQEANPDMEKINKIFREMRAGPVEDLTQHLGEHVVAIKLDFDWIDFGTWESISRYVGEYEPNSRHKDKIEIDSENNFIRAQKGKVIATIGIENIAIIDTKDALLVCPLNRSGEAVSYTHLTLPTN